MTFSEKGSIADVPIGGLFAAGCGCVYRKNGAKLPANSFLVHWITHVEVCGRPHTALVTLGLSWHLKAPVWYDPFRAALKNAFE